MVQKPWKQHFETAIHELGSQPKLAKAMGCSQSKVSWLLKCADQISAEDAIAVQRATGGKVTVYQLRPDIEWPSPSEPERAAS